MASLNDFVSTQKLLFGSISAIASCAFMDEFEKFLRNMIHLLVNSIILWIVTFSTLTSVRPLLRALSTTNEEARQATSIWCDGRAFRAVIFWWLKVAALITMADDLLVKHVLTCPEIYHYIIINEAFAALGTELAQFVGVWLLRKFHVPLNAGLVYLVLLGVWLYNRPLLRTEYSELKMLG